MTAADIGTQIFMEGKSLEQQRQDDKNNNNNHYSWQRTLRWTMAGICLHGPYFLTGFSILDKHFGAATSLQIVAKKTMTAQLLLFPPYLVALFGFMGALEQHPDIAQKIRQRIPETFVSGCVFWPIANAINFSNVSPSLRVPYLAVSAGIWNSYLSWTNAKGQQGAEKDMGQVNTNDDDDDDDKTSV